MFGLCSRIAEECRGWLDSSYTGRDMASVRSFVADSASRLRADDDEYIALVFCQWAECVAVSTAGVSRLTWVIAGVGCSSVAGVGRADGVPERGLGLGEDGVDEAEEEWVRAFGARLELWVKL